MKFSDVEPLTDMQIKASQEVNSIVIQHEALTKIVDDAIEMALMMQAVKIPAGILIQAESGMGKSLLLRLIREEVDQRLNKTFNQNKALKIELDSAVDVIRMAGFFTRALGYPMLPSKGRLETMNGMIANALERIQPVIATIDETQHICEGNRQITARSVTDWLKVRMDAHNFAVICAGTDGLEKLCEINPQFTSRASSNYVLEPFSLDQQWLSVLHGYVQNVSTVNLGVIAVGAVRKLHLATKGNMRSLKRILIYAAVTAVANQDRTLQMKDLELAFDRHAGLSGNQSNPFRVV